MKNIALSQKIKELRMMTGSSQEELAIVTQLSLRTIQRIENGETRVRETDLVALHGVAVDDGRTTVVRSTVGKGSLCSRKEFLRDRAAFREHSKNSAHYVSVKKCIG